MYGFTHPSVLNCFTDKEKNAQINIGLLGPMTVRHPFLRNLVMNHLIYLPTNKFFEKVYNIEKTLTYQSRVYKTKYSLGERLNVLKKVFSLDKLKRN